jgi:SHS2 domain-containing protein
MSMKKRFETLEHTADVYIAAYGQSLEEAFENAASATFNAMTEIEKIRSEVEEIVEVEAHDEHALLYSWIEELLVRFETTGKLYCCFNISSIEKTPTCLKLKAKIWGEPFDSDRHLQKVGIKAVTYHRMEIVKKPKVVTVKFILDV